MEVRPVICYKVVDDCIVSRTFKRKETCDAEAAAIVCEAAKDDKILFMDLPVGNTWYKRCCELSHLSEYAAEYTWFVSHNNDNILCLAALAVIERYNTWEVLMDEDMFYKWLLERMR